MQDTSEMKHVVIDEHQRVGQLLQGLQRIGKLHPKVSRVAASCHVDDPLANLNYSGHPSYDSCSQKSEASPLSAQAVQVVLQICVTNRRSSQRPHMLRPHSSGYASQ